MGVQIEGAGGGELVEVTNKRLDVNSKTTRRSFFISRDDGQVFNLNSHDASAAAGTHIVYWQNTSPTRNLVIDLVRMGGVETALWKVWFVTGTAAGGSLLTPTNMNGASANAAEGITRGDGEVTGLTQVAEIANIRSPANESMTVPFDATLIIRQNNAIAVEYDTGTTGIAEVLIRGFYE